VSILGFYAFGTDVSDNVLLAFEKGPHHWVVTMACMLVVVHVAAAFQVWLPGARARVAVWAVCRALLCRGQHAQL
jgi:hypothetical protein